MLSVWALQAEYEDVISLKDVKRFRSPSDVFIRVSMTSTDGLLVRSDTGFYYTTAKETRIYHYNTIELLHWFYQARADLTSLYGRLP